MSTSNKTPIFTCPRQARHSLQFAALLFPIWGLSWLVFWLALKQLTINGPIVSLLFVRNAMCFVLAGIPIRLGLQGLKELQRHPGYSTGYLRSVLGISVGAGFLIVEVITLFLSIAFALQKTALS